MFWTKCPLRSQTWRNGCWAPCSCATVIRLPRSSMPDIFHSVNISSLQWPIVRMVVIVTYFQKGASVQGLPFKRHQKGAQSLYQKGISVNEQQSSALWKGFVHLYIFDNQYYNTEVDVKKLFDHQYFSTFMWEKQDLYHQSDQKIGTLSRQMLQNIIW